MKAIKSKKITALFSLLLLSVLSLVILEVNFYTNPPSESEIEEMAAQNVGSAVKVLERFITDFKSKSRLLGKKVTPLLSKDSSSEQIHDLINKETNFWGVELRDSTKALVWTGFRIPNNEPSAISDTLLIEIVNVQNVLAIKATQWLFDDLGSSYSLTSAKKLKQTNVLDLGSDTELSISDVLGIDFNFPVHFSINEPIPDEVIFKTEQSFKEGNFTTTVYAAEDDIDTFSESRKADHSKLRLIFIVLIIFITELFLSSLSFIYDPKKVFLISTASIFIFWILSWVLLPFLDLDLVLGAQTVQTELFYLGLNSFLAFAFAVFITDFYYSNKSFKYKLPLAYGVIINSVIGILIALVLVGISLSLFSIAAQTSLNLNDLSLIPELSVFLYFFFAGVLWIASSWSIVYLFTFLLKSISAKEFISLALLSISFFLTLLVLYLYHLGSEKLWVPVLVSILFFLLIAISYFSWNGFLNLRSKSRLRLLLLICALSSGLAYAPFYYGQMEWRSDTMKKEAMSFAKESELEIETITVETLYILEEVLSKLELSSTDNESLITSEFNSQIELLFRQNPDWQTFSFSVQLIDSNGDPISEFTSNLNAPGWTKAYDMFSLEVPYVQERIRRERIRPIIRRNPLEQPPAKYTSFRQGWIPFFKSPTSEEKLGWIICSVYQEQPQYRKPLRAVVASKKEEDTYSTFLLSEYENKILTRNSLSGLPLEIPNYSMLSEEIDSRLNQDSLFVTSETIHGAEVVELFWKLSPSKVVKVSTLEVTLFNHVFSILRFFFYLLVSIFMISIILQWRRDFKIFESNRKFKDRFIDRFIIASLLCLIALIATSSVAITNQSQDITIDELENKLVGINSTFENSEESDINQTLLLSSTLINSDAVLFEGNTLVGSTAPQIFSQHLLPAQVPWNVYNAIITNGSEIEIEQFTLGELEFLIGYTPVKKEGVITNIAAIPTFLKTPTFNEQLLTTISYLVGLFVLVFGVFIFAAALIANRMTNPLEELTEGIKTISDGSLETTLPVKSNDEIGALTNAFNLMVYRLQELRKNLVEAEREAAWKEMAQQVAHEIKNPLTPMKLNLQHLQRQVKATDIDPEQLKEKVAKINSNMIDQIESLSRIASDFSKFARPLEQEFTKIDLNEILQNVADLYSNEVSIKIDLSLNKTPLWINGVKDELQRVFINLVKNGIEAIPKRRKGIITLKSHHTNYKANIEITDNGEGISAENERSIFVPNFSTKSSGTGLGLAISKKVVEEHGGEIDFISEVGKGTTFTISFELFTGKETE
ncbi:MAG: ATP-binding protein [Balneola sp.]